MRAARGFTLVELAIVLAILAVLASAVAPVGIRQVEVRYAQRTGREITAIQEAAKWYYVDTRGWPGAIDQLRAGGYLSASWPAATPWGDPYTLSAAGTTLSVSAEVPAGLEGVVTQFLISPTTAPGAPGKVRVTSTIPIPGKEASLAMLVHKEGDTMTGPLVIDNAGLSVRQAGGASVFSVDPGSGQTNASALSAGSVTGSSGAFGSAQVGAISGGTATFSGDVTGAHLIATA